MPLATMQIAAVDVALADRIVIYVRQSRRPNWARGSALLSMLPPAALQFVRAAFLHLWPSPPAAVAWPMVLRGALVILGGGVVTCACAAASALGGSALIKAPIEQQCTRYGLKSCPELVDGVLQYVDGDEPGARQQLRRAASKNAPEDLQRFARAISAVLPAKSGNEIAAILTGEVGSDAPADNTLEPVAGNDEASAETESSGSLLPGTQGVEKLDRVQLSMAAQTDPTRMTTESVSPLQDAERAVCQIRGGDAVCVRLGSGPLVVTDAITPSGCTTELLIGAIDADGRLGWIAPTNSPGFHGARFFVRSNEWVVVGARGVPLNGKGDERCYVTWAGFKPRSWLPGM